MSTSSLVDSLRLVFSALGRREIQPYLDQQNQTTVAQIVRESFTNHYCPPSLSGVQPFLFLAEIGAEKLRRDYISSFVSQKLANMSFLAPFTAHDAELSVRLGCLEKLHACLEMVSLLSGTLRLSPNTLGSAARQMLTHLSQHAADPQHTYSFPVKTAEVRAVVCSIPPVLWSLETHNPVRIGNLQESNLLCLSAAHPFLHVSGARGGTESASQEEEGSGAAKESSQETPYHLVRRTETVIVM